MVLVFFTDILTETCKDVAAPLLGKLEGMLNWSVDLDDIDKVLRVEASGDISADIVATLTGSGFNCVYMP